MISVQSYLWLHGIWSFALLPLFFLVNKITSGPTLTLLVWAVVFRLLVFPIDPILEDDYFRYLWDGYVTWSQGSPYGVAPLEFFAHEDLSEALLLLLDNINYPEYATIYGASSQWLFLLSYGLSGGELWSLQLLILVLDLILLVVIYRYLPSRWFIFWGWNFFLIKEFTISLHIDLLGVLFIVCGYILLREGSESSSSKAVNPVNRQNKIYLAALCLAISVCAKLTALIALPFFVKQLKLKGTLCFLLVCCAVYLPFVLQSSQTDFSTFLQFLQGWYFNSPLFFLLFELTNLSFAKFTLMISFVLIYYWQLYRYWFNGDRLEDSLFIIFAALMLLSTVFNPWYWIWVLPWAMCQRLWWPWLLSLTLSLSYLTGLNLNDDNLQAYEQPGLYLLLEFLPIFVLACYEWMKHRRVALQTS